MVSKLTITERLTDVGLSHVYAYAGHLGDSRRKVSEVQLCEVVGVVGVLTGTERPTPHSSPLRCQMAAGYPIATWHEHVPRER